MNSNRIKSLPLQILTLLLLCSYSLQGKNLDREEYKSQVDAPLVNNDQINEDAYRILFIGDSITRHGISERLDWKHIAGMAADSEANDYVHLLANMIQQIKPNQAVNIHIHSGGGSGKAQQRYNAINEVLPIRPHLIIIQLGEHEKEADGVEKLRTDYEKLITAFSKQTAPKAQVIATGNWSLSKPQMQPDGSKTYSGWPLTVERTMREVCEVHNIPFVSVADIAMDPKAHGYGIHKGVMWHPNNKGHKGYANRIFEAYVNLPTN